MDTKNMEKVSEPDIAQLDKFKRRLIRSVAGMLIHQKLPEKDVWKEMKKVMGCDCRQLWEHMKSLTQKKLRRLLVAEDKAQCIPDIARMTLTDWQLYDQVLVHEDFDVVGLHTLSKTDNKVLIDLFALVQRFSVETKRGSALADAWTAATVYYNSQGHQCSPMLLQKRWYQLKAETRRRFYKFWQEYRGNEKQIVKADQYRPTVLQRTVAKRFPELITQKFPDWETRIEESLVILPDDFESRKNTKVLQNPNEENTPDIVIMEPYIETVDLLQESDSEEENSHGESTQTPESQNDSDPMTSVKIKVEPEDPVIDYTAVEEPKKTEIAMAQVVQEATLFDNINDDINDLTTEAHSIIKIASSFENNIINGENVAREQENPDENQDLIPKITNVFGNIQMTDETLSVINNFAKNSISDADISHNNTVKNKDNNEINSEKVDNSAGPICLHVDIMDSDEEIDYETNNSYVQKPTNKNILKETTINADLSPVILSTVSLRPDNDANAILSKISDTKVKSVLNERISITDSADITKVHYGSLDLSSFGEIPENLNFADDGIEIVDDGMADINQSPEISQKEHIKEIGNENTDAATTKSSKDSSDNQEFKLDEKLFLDPVVYTQKLDEMCILKNKNINAINVKTLLKNIILESKPISSRSVDAQKIYIERQRVSLSSYMLQKPKNRKYNSIQLCKNPDFNTRLKRLTAGFLSSWQNRTLLKACKPLTIDLTKAFESKLVNNTIYLKKSDKNQVIEIDEDQEKITSVMPSSIPVQTLIDNTRLDDVLKFKDGYNSDSSSSPSEDIFLERNKVIHLPDIIQIRRINQTLLTAEVSPIQIQNTSNVSKSKDTHTGPVPVSNSNNIETKLNANIDLNNAIKRDNEDGISRDTAISDAHNSKTNYVGAKAVDYVFPSSKLLTRMLEAPARSPVFKNPIQNDLNKQPSAKNRSQIVTENPNKRRYSKKSTTSRLNQPTWISGYQSSDMKQEEFLLTHDTLHKMLYLFNGKNEDKSLKSLQTAQKKKFKENVEKDKEKKAQKQRNRSAKALDQRSKKGNTTQRRPNVVTKVVYKNEPCCWAREQIDIDTKKTMNNLSCTSKHKCLLVGDCICCCKDDLEKMIAVDKIRPQSDVSTSRQVSHTLLSPKGSIQTTDTDTDNKPLHAQLQDSNEVKVTHVYTLNPEGDTEQSSNPPDFVASSEEPLNVVVEQSINTSHEIINENVDIPIYDDTQPIMSETKPRNVTRPKKMNFEINKPNVDEIPLTESIMNSDATISAVEHNLNIPIYDESRVDKATDTPQILVAPVMPADSAVETHNVPIRDDTKFVDPISQPLLDSLDGPIKINDLNITPKQCSCKISIYNERKNKRITVDGSEKCIKHKNNERLRVTSGPSDKKKVLILNSKQIPQVPAGCPIFLGNNKVLLTNIKFPDSVQEQNQEPSKIINFPQDSAPPLPLSDGLLLYNHNQLKYAMKPGVKLNPEDKEKMPAPLESIQRQMNLSRTLTTTTSGDISIDSEVVDISDDETLSTSCVVNNVSSPSATTTCDLQNSGNDSNTNKSLEQKETPTTTAKEIPPNELNSNEFTQIQHTATYHYADNEECSQNITITSNEISEQNEESIENTAPESSITNLTHGGNVNNGVEISINDVNPDVNTASSSSSKKTILSDLMEMSGILPEDSTSVQVTPEYNEAPNSFNPIPSTSLSNNPLQVFHELYTVSSFSHLKYACQNNGHFYKLDYETGALVPINVCLKKKLQNNASEIRILPKETIDLTEDVEFSDKNENTAQPVSLTTLVQSRTPSKTQSRSLLKVNAVRPVTMFRTLQRPRILRQISKSALPSNLQIIKTPLGQRLKCTSPVKQNVEKNQLVSKNRKSIPEPTTYLSLSESSDDEPLIKKVKRKQLQESKANFEFDLPKDIENVPNLIRNLTPGPKDDPTALAEDDIRLFEDPPNEPLSMEDDDIVPLPYTIVSKEIDDSNEEDCILGV